MLDIISKFSDYPVWVKAIAIIWVASTAALIFIQLFIKPTPSKETTKKYLLSDEDKQDIVDRIAKNLQPKLLSEYPDGYILFGIVHKNIIIPSEQIPSSLRVDWKPAKIIKDFGNRVEISLPNITGDFKNVKDFSFGGNVVRLEKKLGSKFAISFGALKINLKIVAIKEDLLVVSIGIKALP